MNRPRIDELAPPPPPTPSVGRVVHVVTFDGHHRPAHIIDPADGSAICVLAMVHPLDRTNDTGGACGSVLWLIEDCPFDAAGLLPGSWHWPERV